MYLRKAHIYIIGMVLIGFHFAGTSVSVFPESRFPFHRIHGFPEPEYSHRQAQYYDKDKIRMTVFIARLILSLKFSPPQPLPEIEA